MKNNSLKLGELMVSRAAGVNPSRHLDEIFELFSIPAFDRGESDFLRGSEIGSTKQRVLPGDVLLSKIVPHIRRAWLVTPDRGRRQIASGEWIVFRESRFHGPYLRHVLTADTFHRKFMNTVAGVGGSLLRARPAQVAEIEVPLPALERQRRIAAILDKADELRAKRRQAIAHLDTLTQSIFHSMFGDPAANTLGWELQKLGDVGNLDRGVSKHRPRNDPKLLGGAHPLIQTGDVAGADAYITKFNTTYSDVGLNQSRLWPAGTLCITIAANIAKTAILRIDACFPDSVVGFTAHPATTEYVRVWLSFLQATLEARAPESAQKNINLAILRGLPIPIPPLELQQTFATRVAAVERLKETHRKHLAELDALFSSLQSRAFKANFKPEPSAHPDLSPYGNNC